MIWSGADWRENKPCREPEVRLHPKTKLWDRLQSIFGNPASVRDSLAEIRELVGKVREIEATQGNHREELVFFLGKGVLDASSEEWLLRECAPCRIVRPDESPIFGREETWEIRKGIWGIFNSGFRPPFPGGGESAETGFGEHDDRWPPSFPITDNGFGGKGKDPFDVIYYLKDFKYKTWKV